MISGQKRPAMSCCFEGCASSQDLWRRAMAAITRKKSRLMRPGSIRAAVSVLALLPLWLAPASCSDAGSETRPFRELKLHGGAEQLSTSGSYLVYRAPATEDLMYVWTWDDLERPANKVETGRALTTACTFQGRPVLEGSDKTRDDASGAIIVLEDFVSNRCRKRWDLGPDFYSSHLSSSRNGKYVAVVAEGTRLLGDKMPLHMLARLGVISTQKESLTWVANLKCIGGGIGPSLTTGGISEDGQFMAAVGVKSGAWILVADVRQKRVLWQNVPTGSVAFADVVFSPSGREVYAAGGGGRVYGFEVATGKIISNWVIHESGKPKYGHRATRLATSPDGRWLGIGTGPKGNVYVFEREGGKRVSQFNTKDATIMGLAFSPDSSLLATVGVGSRTIKIWRMPDTNTSRQRPEKPTFKITKQLPRGFEAVASRGGHASGWPLEIRCLKDDAVMVFVPGGQVLSGLSSDPEADRHDGCPMGRADGHRLEETRDAEPYEGTRPYR